MNRYADKQATRKLLLPQFPLINFNSRRPQKGESCRWPLVSLCHVFFLWFLDWFYKNEGMRTRHQTVFYIMNIREFQLSWQKGFVNIYGKKKNWNQWTCVISFFPPYLIQPPYQAGSDQLTLVFVPFLLFQSISWNHFLIFQTPATLDFLLIVTCKSNKYKRRVQNMPFL